jgi:small-conductance mechanosensitive channel/CRP-like cAMP-binding protein
LIVGGPWLRAADGEPTGWIFHVAGTLTGLVATWVAVRFVDVLAWGTVEHRGLHVPRLLKDLVAFLIFLVGVLLVILFVFDQPITGILATSGVLGLILGFGMRNLIADIFSGIAINVDQAYRVGQWIEIHPRSVEPMKGCVTEISWRSTRIRTIDNTMIVLPNSLISSIVVVNLSAPTPPSRFQLEFVLDFSVPVDRALRVLSAGAKAARGPLSDPPPKVTVSRVRDWGVEYEVLYWLDAAVVSPRKGRHAVNASVLEHLRLSGISLAHHKEEIYLTRNHARALGKLEHRVSVLRRVDLFSGLENDELERLANKMRQRQFQAGIVIVEKGQPGDSMYVVVEGVLDVYTHPEGAEDQRKVVTIQPGQFFGEMSLLTGEPRSATVTAATEVILYQISKDDLNVLIEERPEIMILLTQTVAERIDNLRALGSAPRDEIVVAQHSFTEQVLERMKRFFR